MRTNPHEHEHEQTHEPYEYASDARDIRASVTEGQDRETTRMRIRACLSGLALASSLMLTTACGVVGDDSGNGGEGTQKTANNASPSESPVSAPPGAAKAPGFDFPDGVYVVIANEMTGDNEKDEVLRDHSRATMAMVLAYAKATAKLPQVAKYRQDGAAGALRERVKTYQREVLVGRGIYRYYKRELTMDGALEATIRFCESRREAFDRSLSSGKALRTRPSVKDFARVEDVLQKREGTWRVVATASKKGVQDCRR